jgi:hypothetical protein
VTVCKVQQMHLAQVPMRKSESKIEREATRGVHAKARGKEGEAFANSDHLQGGQRSLLWLGKGQES